MEVSGQGGDSSADQHGGLSYDDPSQGWAWRSRLFSACRQVGLNPCRENDLNAFFVRAAAAARGEGIPIAAKDHFVAYQESLKTIDYLKARPGAHVFGFYPDIATHVRWYIDVTFRPREQDSCTRRVLASAAIPVRVAA
jgi:hypothetical protein